MGVNSTGTTFGNDLQERSSHRSDPSCPVNLGGVSSKVIEKILADLSAISLII